MHDKPKLVYKTQYNIILQSQRKGHLYSLLSIASNKKKKKQKEQKGLVGGKQVVQSTFQ